VIPTGAAPRPQQVLLFSAGGMRLGVFIAEVGRLLVETQTAPVPFSHPAMAGLLIDDEAIIPVFDLCGVIDESTPPPRRAPGATVALFPTERGPIGLRLDALHGTIAEHVPASSAERDALLKPLSPGARRAVTDAALSHGVPFLFFSPEALVVELGLVAGAGPHPFLSNLAPTR
jgi:hypothetical protein